jgi:hypothetical protein
VPNDELSRHGVGPSSGTGAAEGFAIPRGSKVVSPTQRWIEMHSEVSSRAALEPAEAVSGHDASAEQLPGVCAGSTPGGVRVLLRIDAARVEQAGCTASRARRPGSLEVQGYVGDRHGKGPGAQSSGASA